MARQKFWMVLGRGTPTFRHYTKASAVTEAERLASLNPGQEFHVLESLAACKKQDVVWENTEATTVGCSCDPLDVRVEISEF